MIKFFPNFVITQEDIYLYHLLKSELHSLDNGKVSDDFEVDNEKHVKIEDESEDTGR